MKDLAEALYRKTSEMESSLWGLRPQSCSEQWKDYFSGGQRISSSRKAHCGYLILVPTLSFPGALLGYHRGWQTCTACGLHSVYLMKVVAPVPASSIQQYCHMQTE